MAYLPDINVYSCSTLTINYAHREPDENNCTNGSLELLIEGGSDPQRRVRIVLHDPAIEKPYPRDSIQIRLGDRLASLDDITPTTSDMETV